MSRAGCRAGVAIRTLEPSHWALLRGLRLRSLESDASAFLGGHTEAAAWGEATWRTICVTGQWFRAALGGVDVGLMRIMDYPAESPRLHLEAMWVVPSGRRRGVATTLVRHAEGVAVGQGERSLGLWVCGGNEAARSLYENLGYRASGRSGLLPDGRTETELIRALRG